MIQQQLIYAITLRGVPLEFYSTKSDCKTAIETAIKKDPTLIFNIKSYVLNTVCKDIDWNKVEQLIAE